MNIKNVLISSALTVGLGFSVAFTSKVGVQFHAMKKTFWNSENDGDEKNEKTEIEGAIKYYNMLHRNVLTGNVEVSDYINALEQIKIHDASRQANSLSLSWSEMGPDDVGGRTRALLLYKHSTTSPKKIFAGGVGGGLWVSYNSGGSWTVVPGTDKAESANISGICESANGDIYYITGEGLYTQYGAESGGLLGYGVYKSVDGGESFTQLSSTKPPGGAQSLNSGTWATTFECAASPTLNGRIYVGTNSGLKISDDGGATWTSAIAGTSRCVDVVVASDGSVVANIGSNVYTSPAGDPNTFTQVPQGTTVGKLPTGTTQLAVAPSNPNYIYAVVLSGQTSIKGVYKSTDKGQTWSVIGTGGTSLFAPINQGEFACAIAVFPSDPDKIVIGGLDCWTYSVADGWNQISEWAPAQGIFSPTYVHADIHKFIFLNNDVYLVGCDGGVFRSQGQTGSVGRFHTDLDRGYNVTQFYTVAATREGQVFGGAQDNGTHYISFAGQTVQSSEEINGGDGAGVAISRLNPNAFFTGTYYGATRRTANRGFGNKFYSKELDSLVSGGILGASFTTPIRVWESWNDPLSQDSISYTNDSENSLAIDSAITIQTGLGDIAYNYVLPFVVNPHQTIKVPNKIQSKCVVGFNNQVWMTKQGINFSITPEWYCISKTVSGTVHNMAFSNDGAHLFVGTEGGALYRIDSLETAVNKKTADVRQSTCKLKTTMIAQFSPSRVITSISIDPRNSNNIIVTLAGYGATSFIYRGTNAITMPSSSSASNFTSIQGSLPQFPIYSSVIDYNPGSTNVVIGTEYGIYTADNGLTGTPAWTKDLNFPNVAVFDLMQQTLPYEECWNSGAIYAATHGRGIFSSTTLLGMKNLSNTPIAVQPRLNVYPNPLTDRTTVTFNLPHASDISVKIFDLNGRVVKEMEMPMMASGLNKINIECNELSSGTYFVNIRDNKEVNTSSKFVVIK